MKDKFIVIQQWMITELGLKGSELIAYALIYGLTIHESDYHGTAEYLSTWLGITPKKCYRVLSSLCERGLLVRTEFSRIIHYTATIDSSKMEPEGSEKGFDSSKMEPYGSKREPDNITDNINISITDKINADGDLFPSEHINESVKVTRPRRTSETAACLFENSRFYDFDRFAAEFKAPEFSDIDIVYYFHAVADWSAQHGRKMKDWIATARNFIRGDLEKGKLHRKSANGPALSPEAIEYLESMAD